MIISTGTEKLNQIFEERNIRHYRKRFSFPNLMAYLKQPKDNKVCTLFGLRRTGKTTMMAQAAQELASTGEVAWLYCEKDDCVQDIKNAIFEHPECRYFFIDEVTRLEDFTDAGSILADLYVAEEGKKIVLTGTDSLGFNLAYASQFPDRMHVIRTTYIPFKEYRYLLGEDKTIDDYIEYGGTLTNGEFYNKGLSIGYTNDAIALNIQHSLELYQDGSHFGSLLSPYASGELTTFINKVVEQNNRTFLATTINKMFKSHDLGNLKKNLGRSEEWRYVDLSPLKSSELKEEIRKALKIKEPLLHKADQKAVEQIKEYLVAMDVVYIPNLDPEHPGNNPVIFTQPGLRYSQVKAELDILAKSPYLKEFSPSERKAFVRRLDDTVKGRMMEDILFVDLSKDEDIASVYQVATYHKNTTGAEYDITLTNTDTDEVILLEVKHSSQYVPAFQARHLLQKEACATLEEDWHVKISGKAVIYRGENQYFGQGVSYWNVADFLDNPKQCLQNIQGYYRMAQEGLDRVAITPALLQIKEEQMEKDKQKICSSKPTGKTLKDQYLLLVQQECANGASLQEFWQFDQQFAQAARREGKQLGSIRKVLKDCSPLKSSPVALQLLMESSKDTEKTLEKNFSQ